MLHEIVSLANIPFAFGHGGDQPGYESFSMKAFVFRSRILSGPGYGYAHNLDPNGISFTMRLGNQNFNTTNATSSYLPLGEGTISVTLWVALQRFC
jgi:hypothetical protein